MEAKIYVQVMGVPKPLFIIVFEDGRVVRADQVFVDGPSELVRDEQLGKLIVLTRSPLRFVGEK